MLNDAVHQLRAAQEGGWGLTANEDDAAHDGDIAQHGPIAVLAWHSLCLAIFDDLAHFPIRHYGTMLLL